MLDVIKHQKKKGHCEDNILDEAVIASVLREVLEGLNHFHCKGLIHRSVASIFVLARYVLSKLFNDWVIMCMLDD